MQNFLIFSICLCSIATISAQENISQRKTSFGIDMILPIVTLSGDVINSPDIELQVKHFINKSAIRLEVVIQTNSHYKNEIGTVQIDDTKFKQYYIPKSGFGFFLGGQRQITSGNFPFYIGIDAGYRWEKGNVSVADCIFEVLGSPCDVFHSLDGSHQSFELAPFIGVRFDLNDRFYINIESGPRLIMDRGKQQTWTSDQRIRTVNIGNNFVDAGTLIRDISLNFRF